MPPAIGDEGPDTPENSSVSQAVSHCAALRHSFGSDSLFGSDFFSPPAEDFFLDVFGSASVGNVPTAY
jgi:hypothetical protein